jgi:hypothetical protein
MNISLFVSYLMAPFQNQDYIALNGMMTDEYELKRIWKEVVVALFWNLPGGTEGGKN